MPNRPTMSLDHFRSTKGSKKYGKVELDYEFSNECYTSPSDYIVLEDETGRFKLSFEEKLNFKMDSIVTGVVMGVIGELSSLGYFIVKDYCFANEKFNIISINDTLQNPLVDYSTENGNFILLTSDFHSHENISLNLLIQFLTGQIEVLKIFENL